MMVWIEKPNRMTEHIERYLTRMPIGYLTMRDELLIILEDGVSISDIWRATGYAYQPILRNINMLEAHGLITTSKDGENKRARKVYLTKKGRAAQTALRYFTEAVIKDDVLEQ